MPVRQSRVFTIPSGAPFLPTLSHALLDGALVDGFPGSGGAMALADATIYVPTQRAAEALAEALLVASGERSLILPRIAPLGAFEPDEAATAFAAESDEAPPRSALPRAVGSLARRHVLATMTRAWGKALGGAIRTVDGDGRLDRRSRRARAGRDDAGAGLRARRRPCGADRRHDHRGRAVGEDRDARARRVRPLLAHHPRLPQDRLRPLAAVARRARPRSTGRPGSRS